MSYFNISQEKIVKFLVYFITMAVFFMWIIIHIQESMNQDLAYLTNSAMHLLSGEKMSDSYYEINPPLSVIVQTPSALITKYTNIPIYYAVFIQAIIITVFSFLLMFFIIKKLPWLNWQEKLVFFVSYIMANTLMTGIEFGQKDQYIILFLFPLVLLQALATYRIYVSPLLKWSIIIAGGFFILLKPHYGIIPAVMLIHRFLIQRRLSVVFDKDFFFLGVLFFLYLAVIAIFFNDYITKILPDILIFYVSDIQAHAIIMGLNYGFIIILFMTLCMFLVKRAQKFILFLFFMSLLSLIPFVIQGKGADYHTMPARTFFICGISILTISIMLIIFRKIFVKNYIYIAMFLTLTIISFIIYPFFTRPLVRMSHNEYKQSKIVKLLQKCNNNDYVFIYDGRSYTAQLSPIYANKKHASRFADFWFIPFFLDIGQAIKQGGDSILSKIELENKIKKYGDMIAEDINKYKAGIILISPINYFQMIEQPFMLKSYFSKYSDNFKYIWNEYEKIDEVEIDRTPYLARENIYNKGIYQVYRRKECNKG